MINKSLVGVVVGFLLGTVGVPLLKTATAKKVYTYATAGAFIAKDKVLECAEVAQGMALDIADDAKVIVEKYYQDKDKQYEAAVEVTETTEA